MIGLFDALARPLLRHMDAENAHALAVLGLRLSPIFPRRADDESLAVRAFGLNFPNPVGMAAGNRNERGQRRSIQPDRQSGFRANN